MQTSNLLNSLIRKSLVLSFIIFTLGACKKDDPSKNRSYYGKWKIVEVYTHAYLVQGNNTVTTSYFHQHQNVKGEVDFNRKKLKGSSTDKSGSFTLSMDKITDPISMSKIPIKVSGEFGWMLPTYRDGVLMIEQTDNNIEALGIGAAYVSSFYVEEISRKRLKITTRFAGIGNNYVINGMILE
jgi:hypothetical protein